MTPHNHAKKEDIAKVVIMPGDPLRAEWIAKTFLTDVKKVNDVRGMFAFTGTYNDKRITVMGSGMGMPSIGIYSHELFAKNLYDVSAIIRVGSCASWTKDLTLGKVIVAEESMSYSTYAKFLNIEYKDTYRGSSKLLEIAKSKSEPIKENVTFGKMYCNDVFYRDPSTSIEDRVKQAKGSLGSEMEIYALYANAINNNKEALGLVSVSDSLVNKQFMSPEDRQTSFHEMIKFALEIAVEYLNSK